MRPILPVVLLTVLLLLPAVPEVRAGEADGLVWPCGGVVVQEFGGPHEGIDITNLKDTPLKSMGPGVVTRCFRNSWYGNALIIRLNNGLELLYAHLRDYANGHGNTSTGMRVLAGTVIGRMGTTGASNGIHLHLEIRRDGRLINPRVILDPLPKPPAQDPELDDLDADLTGPDRERRERAWLQIRHHLREQ